MPKLQTDPVVVARLAAEKEDENWRFRSFLKGADLGNCAICPIVFNVYERLKADLWR